MPNGFFPRTTGARGLSRSTTREPIRRTDPSGVPFPSADTVPQINPRSSFRGLTELRPVSAVVGPGGEETVQFGPQRDEELRQRVLGLFDEQGGATAPTVSRTTGDIAEREQAARDAAFNREKDRAGQIARSSLNTLREQLSSAGRAGGTFEDERLAGLIGRTAGGLESFGREQAIGEAQRAQQVGDLEFQGGIAQRGQTLQAQQAARNALFSLLTSGGGGVLF